MKMRLFLSAGLPVLLLCACKKGNDVTISTGTTGNYVARVNFVIDGRQFSQQAVTINGTSKGGNACVYQPKYKISSISISDAVTAGDQSKNDFFVIFNGNSASTQHAGDDTNGGTYSSVYFEVSATDKAGKRHEYHFEDSYNTPGAIQITKFGSVSDSVTGKFSGLLIDENGEPTIHITNGSFSVTRNADLN